jgi:hypothetical protein
MSKYAVVIYFILIGSFVRGQVLCDMYPYRNVTYINTGLNNAFANTTIGIARSEYLKCINKKIIGILDISLPVTDLFFTRRSIRKGLQLDLINKNDFKLPFLIASSSIFRRDDYLKIHDVTLETAFSPGIYKKHFFLALDLRYEIIFFRYYVYSKLYQSEKNSLPKNHWEEPNNSIAKIGLICGLDLKNYFLQFRCGYEKYPSVVHQLIPAYMVISGGLKFGSKRPLRML